MARGNKHDEASVTGTRRMFAPTRWSLVKRAVSSPDDLGKWIEIYWYPLYAWARHKGSTPEDAADAVQGFLARVCEKRLLAKVDRSKGALHSWLLASFGNFLVSAERHRRRAKRGGNHQHVSIDIDLAESAYEGAHSSGDQPEDVFARAWALTLLDEALASMRDYFENSGRLALFEALVPVLEEAPSDTSYAEMAEKLEMSPGALRQAALRFRQRYRRCLLQVASKRLGISSEVKLRAELRQMLE